MCLYRHSYSTYNLTYSRHNMYSGGIFLDELHFWLLSKKKLNIPKKCSTVLEDIKNRTDVPITHSVMCTLPNPANTRRSANVGTLLAYRLRRWANIIPTLGERLVFAGKGRD